MVSRATKRRRTQRGNVTAEVIEDSRHQAQAEKRVLGTTVTPSVPDKSLFQVDRKGTSKDVLREKIFVDARQQKLELKRLRRTTPKPRRSELLANVNQDEEMYGVSFPEGSLKKQNEFGSVEKTILKRRKGKLGKAEIKPRLNFVPGKEDVWTSETKEQVDKEITDTNKKLIRKLTKKHRRAHAIIFPDAGHSVNPSYKHHQDKLGEALANIVAEEDRNRWDEEKLSFDPELLKSSSEKIDKVTGMHIDSQPTLLSKENDEDDEGDEDDLLVVRNRTVPERKTRSERNKEARKTEMRCNIMKKKRETRFIDDLSKVEKLVESAQEEADKLNGDRKKALRKLYVPVPGRKQDRPVLMKIAGQRTRKEAYNERVALSEELAACWRTVQTAKGGALMKERLLSFERRGMVEPPRVIPKEVWRMNQEKRLDELKDKTKRRGRHSKSNISYWREKSRKR